MRPNHQFHFNLPTVNNYQDKPQINMDVLNLAHFEQFDTSNINAADVERLRSLLPQELQQPGKLSQLEIILEAIHYIKMLQNKLGS